MKVLKEIEIKHKPIILVFNKIDKISARALSALKLKYRNSIFISALKKTGLENLYDKIKKNVDKNRLTLTLKIPYEESKLMSFVYNYCKILEKKYTDDSLVIKLNANKRFQKKLSPFIISDYIMT